MHFEVNQRAEIYISEMAVSNMHGGGLTVQRILGDDLERFRFVQIGMHYKFCPYVDRLRDRVKYINLPLHRPPRKHVSRYISYLWGRYWLKRMPRNDVNTSLICSEIMKDIKLKDTKVLIIPQSEASVYVANALYRAQPFDYVTWVMDDHALRYVNGGFAYREDGFEEEMEFHLKNAKAVFVISHEMRDFYKSRFGVDSDILFGPAEVQERPVYESNKDNEISLCYFGALMEWQKDALRKLVQKLDDLNVKLDIYTYQKPSEELQNQWVSFKSPVKSEIVLTVMRKYDAVVLPVGFHETIRHLSELNYSTKMSEYLASGIPTLAIGPEYAAMIKFLRRYNAALIIDNPSDDNQWKAIQFLKDTEFRRNIITNAMNAVAKEATTDIMRKRWASVWHNL